jgi:hypothetical protein
MRLFIKIFADDLKSSSSTNPFIIKGDASEITIEQLKNEIEIQI